MKWSLGKLILSILCLAGYRSFKDVAEKTREAPSQSVKYERTAHLLLGASVALSATTVVDLLIGGNRN